MSRYNRTCHSSQKQHSSRQRSMQRNKKQKRKKVEKQKKVRTRNKKYLTVVVNKSKLHSSMDSKLGHGIEATKAYSARS
ncbi:hypothetical protein XELAEV_18002544mg [Xenopus laevis]|uniref:Uncharacterized protein n=1 Tax=Xenopus laevis TaxID=8355 RepID=A0A974BNI8_XENLA|nr:hypothetical protein XELAEV_18002544mg [Xenopus laevis]